MENKRILNGTEGFRISEELCRTDFRSKDKKGKIMSKKPTVLMILDGYGLNDRHDGNAVYEAKTTGYGRTHERLSVC